MTTNKSHIFYNIDRFTKLFIDVISDFDNYFIDRNNNLVNCDNSYLQYKRTYIDETMNNLHIFKVLVNSFDMINNNYEKTDKKKYTYHYIDFNEYDVLNNKLKNVLEIQKKNLNNFINYIELLNMESSTEVVLEKIRNNSRMSKLSSK